MFKSEDIIVIPLVLPSSIRLFLKTCPEILVTEETSYTGVILRSIAAAPSGSDASSAPKPWPASIVSRLVPRESNSLIRSALPDADNPRTPTTAAIPIVIPKADKADLNLRVLSPDTLTLKISMSVKWLLGKLPLCLDALRSFTRPACHQFRHL